jgi:hypothetical protein
MKKQSSYSSFWFYLLACCASLVTGQGGGEYYGVEDYGGGDYGDGDYGGGGISKNCKGPNDSIIEGALGTSIITGSLIYFFYLFKKESEFTEIVKFWVKKSPFRQALPQGESIFHGFYEQNSKRFYMDNIRITIENFSITGNGGGQRRKI